MKRCSYCAEEIQDEAIKCKHCNEFLQALAPASNPPAVHTLKNFLNFDDPATKRTAIISFIGFLLIVLCAMGYQHHRSVLAQQAQQAEEAERVAKAEQQKEREERASQIATLKKAMEPFERLEASISAGLRISQLETLTQDCQLSLNTLAGQHFTQHDLERVRLDFVKNLERVIDFSKDTARFCYLKANNEDGNSGIEESRKIENKWCVTLIGHTDSDTPLVPGSYYFLSDGPSGLLSRLDSLITESLTPIASLRVDQLVPEPSPTPTGGSSLSPLDAWSKATGR